MLQRCCSWIADHPWRTLAGVCALALLALLPASRLRLTTELTALLPEGSPHSAGYALFLDHFGGAQEAYVVLRAPAATPVATLTTATRRLMEGLEESPEVAAVRSGPGGEEMRFFFQRVAPRVPLLLPEMGEAWRQTIATHTGPEAIRQRARELRGLAASPTGRLLAPVLRQDPLGFAADLPAFAGVRGLGGPILVGEAEGSPLALLVVTPARSEIDPAGGRALLAAVEAAWAAVGASAALDTTGIELLATGGPLYAAHDETLMRRDLRRTITGSFLLCAVLLLAVFAVPRIPLVVFAAVLVALVLTAGVLGGVLGSLTAVSLGFAAVLIGLGIDYGIHGGTRYAEARQEGETPAEALATAVRRAGPGIATSALTTAAAFGVLAFAHLRPLREVGLAVAVGIVAIFLVSATLGSALLVLWGGRGGAGPLWRPLGHGAAAVIRLGERWPWAVLIGAVLLTGMAGVGLAGLRLDADPKSLRPDDHPALRAEALLTAGFDLLQDTATVVIPAPDVAQALARSAAVRRHLRAVLREAGEGGEITAPSDWLGPGATVVAARRALLAEASPGSPLDLNQAAATLRAALVEEGLDPAFYAPGFAALAALARGEDPVPSVLPPSEAAASWPPAMAELIRQDPSPGGGVWAAVRLRLPAGTWADGPPPDVWAAVVQDAPGAGYASVVALGTDLQRTARRDLRGLGWGALAVVALVVLLSFRGRPGRSLLAFLPVSLGVVWTLGLWGGLGQPLDLISLAVLPILLGIGIDDGLHAVHGAVELGHLGLLPAAVRDAGRAIALTTLTTCAGFLSLRLSHIPGLQAGGLLVALGVAACLVATLLVLPAVGTLLARWVPGCAVDAVAERPPHAPRRGWITGVFWYRALQFGVGCLPSWGRATLNTILAPLFFLFAGWIRRALASNLEPVLGPAGFWERQRRAFRTWWTFSWCLVERYERFCPSQDKLEVEIEGREIWNHLLESPKGWILITAHMGHWELGSELAVEGQRMVHVVREQEMDPEAQELIRQQVESAVAESTNYKVHFASRDPALGAELLSALRRGDLVCLQGDRPRAHSRAIETTLFGRPFLLPAGPTALARAAGVPMLPIFGFREGRRKARFVFRPPIEVLDTGDRCRDLQTAVQALASEIEWAVRQRPHQWFCFRDLWG